MPLLTDEDIAAIKAERARLAEDRGVSFGDLGRYYRRGERLFARAVEVGLAFNPITGLAQLPYKYLAEKIRPGPETLPFEPASHADILKGLRAAGSAWFEGDGIDVDAALAAYEEAAPAGWGRRGGTEIAASALLPFGLAKTGVGLASRAPKLAGTLGRIAPAAVRPGVTRGIETGLRGTGKVLRAPWEAEEALGRGALKGLGFAARPIAGPVSRAVSRMRAGREAPPVMGEVAEDIQKADELLGPTPTAAPVTGKIFHGTRHPNPESFIDENGNLVLRASENFEGKTVGVSFSESQDTALDYATRIPGAGPARSKAQGAVFEIDADAIPAERLFAESGEEIATRGAESVIIPQGKFRIIKDIAARTELEKWEALQIARVKRLSDPELADEWDATLTAGEVGEFNKVFEDPVARATPGVSQDIVAKYGPVMPDSFPVWDEIIARVKTSSNPARTLARIVSGLPETPQGFMGMSRDELAKDIRREIADPTWRDKFTYRGASDAPTPEQDIAVRSLREKWEAAKARNSARATKDLEDLKAKGFDTDNAESALKEYKDTVRGDFDEVDDFTEARSEAWDNFVNELDDIALVTTPTAPVTGVARAGMQAPTHAQLRDAISAMPEEELNEVIALVADDVFEVIGSGKTGKARPWGIYWKAKYENEGVPLGLRSLGSTSSRFGGTKTKAGAEDFAREFGVRKKLNVAVSGRDEAMFHALIRTRKFDVPTTPTAPVTPGARVVGEQPVSLVGTYDALKVNNAPRTSYVTPRGDDAWKYSDEAYKADAGYMVKSDDTNRALRWVFRLSDGRQVSLQGYLKATHPELLGRVTRGAKALDRIWGQLSHQEKMALVDSIPFEDAVPLTRTYPETGRGNAFGVLEQWLRVNKHPLANTPSAENYLAQTLEAHIRGRRPTTTTAPVTPRVAGKPLIAEEAVPSITPEDVPGLDEIIDVAPTVTGDPTTARQGRPIPTRPIGMEEPVLTPQQVIDADDILGPQVGGTGRKPPGGRKRPSRGEAERGPNDIFLDPMAGFEDAPKLGLWSKGVNAITRMSNWTFGKDIRKRAVGMEGKIETAKRVKAQIVARAESDANTISMFVRKGLRDNFQVEAKTGHILDAALQNKARVVWEGGEAILQSPTLADIAARLDTYTPFLTEKQLVFVRKVWRILEGGTEWDAGGTKVSIPGYNKVLRANMPGLDPKRIRPDIKGNGFFITRGRVRVAGGTATSIGDEIDKLASLGKKRKRGPLPAEEQARMPAMGKMVDANGNVIAHVDRKGRAIAYDPVEKTIYDYVVGVADRITDVKVKTTVRKLAKEFPGTAKITKVVIEGVDEVDDALAAAINRELGVSEMRKLLTAPIIRNVNDMYRGIKANFDLSAVGIHGSLAMFRAPKQWGQATKMTFQSLAATMKGLRRGVQPRGQEIVDEGVELIDQEASAAGRLVSRIWANLGLRFGGTSVETALPGAERLLGQAGEGLRGRVAGAVGGAFQLSNRLFGSFGDVLRLRWADELLKAELAKGKTLKQMFVSGELQQIANAANRMTGWSDKRFGGDLGDVAMFASRFFQSRLETLGQAAVGTGRIATGRAQTIESREALHTMVRLVGLGVVATEMANAMLGNETDRRPFVNGRVNPNFYTIRYGGRDFSIFGPTIGLLRAMGTLAVEWTKDKDRPDKALREASRGLGSGVVRLAWDNITGYGFRGDPAPLGIARGIKGDDPRGAVASPMEVLRYVGELALPIAPGAAVGEIGEGLKSAAEGDWERAIGATAAVGAEIVGGRVARLSRQDEADELAQERYGTSYEKLDVNLRAEIDDLVTEKMGEYGYRGAKGPLYKKRDDANAKLLAGLGATTKKNLTADIASAKWSAKIARQEYNTLREGRRNELYGTTWDPEKGRTVGGIYEELYDMDEPREEPEKGTREHRVWQYYKIFDDALDEDGDMDWDEFDRLESAFWANLTSGEREEMLRNIRTMEREYPEEIRKMAYAGRFAQSVKLNIGGLSTTYWALREHPLLLKFISDETGVHKSTVLRYLKLSYVEREQRRHVPGEARDMENALKKAQGMKGVLTQLQEKFIKEAPNDWILAMMEAGYSYRGSERINNRIRDQIRDGKTVPDKPYEEMYKQQVVSR